LKFPDISHPETLDVRYATVMNDIEIDLMGKLLEMDPYQRITARQALNHEYFDDLRSKDSDYEDEDESINVTSVKDLNVKGNKRVLSPEMMNQQKKNVKQVEVSSTILSKNNKNSFSQPNNNEIQRKSETNYHGF